MARTDNHVDLFLVAPDANGARSTYWQDDGLDWRPWFDLSCDTPIDRRQVVTAATRDEDHLDIFVVDSRGIIQSQHWKASPESPWQGSTATGTSPIARTEQGVSLAQTADTPPAVHTQTVDLGRGRALRQPQLRGRRTPGLRPRAPRPAIQGFHCDRYRQP